VLGGTSPETTSSSPAALAALPSFSGHVLVAEDNPVNQELARTMLQNLGCEVTVVGNGVAAVKAVEAGRFDAVLMDVQMPEMDGLVATATIRSREVRTHARRTPIIALTANAFVQDREACLSAGMDDYLGKPFTLEKLRTALGRWLTSGPSSATATADAAPEEVVESPPPAPSSEARVTLDQRALDQIRALERPGAPSMLGKVIEVYLTTTPRLLTAMRTGMEERDSEAVRQAAHSLKSASANLGATELAELCRILEGQARAGGCPEPGAELEALEAAFQQVRQDLEAELQRG